MQATRRMTSLAILVAASIVAAPRLGAQAQIKVSENVNIKFGVLLQARADWAQDPVTEGYAQNLFLRRARILIGGQVARNVFFFYETENGSLGKAPKGLGSGFQTLDAVLEWRIAKEFNIQGGQIYVPTSREALKSSASELTMDVSDYAYLMSSPMQGTGGRDTGFMIRGYFLNDRLEYRTGAFQGTKAASSRNAYRWTSRLQYNFFDTEVYNMPSYAGSYRGAKKILAVGAACDKQMDYRTFSGDVYASIPTPGGAFEGIVEVQSIDGGTTLTTLPKSTTLTVDAGYYFKAVKVAPYLRYEQRTFSASDAKDEVKYMAGLNWYPYGNNFNVKGSWGRLEPKYGTSTNQFTVQLQFQYF